MRRWGLAIALLLSLGVNVGVLATLAVHRLRPHQERQEPRGSASRRDDPAAREQQRMLGRVERLADRLDLEGEVRSRFVAQQRRFLLATAADRARLARVHTELRQELTAATPDRARVEALTGQASGIYLKLERAMAENVLATRQMLGPDQEEAYLDFVRRLRPGRFTPPGLSDRSWRHGARFRHHF